MISIFTMHAETKLKGIFKRVALYILQQQSNLFIANNNIQKTWKNTFSKRSYINL